MPSDSSERAGTRANEPLLALPPAALPQRLLPTLEGRLGERLTSRRTRVLFACGAKDGVCNGHACVWNTGDGNSYCDWQTDNNW